MVKKSRIEWELRGQHVCGHEYFHVIANATFIKGGYTFAQTREIDAQMRDSKCPRCRLNQLLTE